MPLFVDVISIHAPRAGSDRADFWQDAEGVISIHALRAGSDDILRAFFSMFQINFNPRSPCGERLSETVIASLLPIYFNPRSPCGERPRLYDANV